VQSAARHVGARSNAAFVYCTTDFLFGTIR
jgi:hypothetical protein